MSERNFELEQRDNSQRLYRYGIDNIVRDMFLDRISQSDFKLTSNSKVLEIGSHDGSMTSQILAYVDKIDVLEPVVELHQQIKEAVGENVNIFSGTIESAEFDEEYDAIFLVHVLEHIDNPVDALKRISHWLKPTGFLYLMVPNANALSRQLAQTMGLMGATTDVLPGEKLQGHLRTYTLEHLITDVTQASLKVTETGGILHKPLANFQLDKCIEEEIIGQDYLNALDDYAKINPKEASSIFVVASSAIQ
jgi:2-polyprenyl-3-methyl-5-hydroxy-6-metoxy-1,4-benzoquinol methylase